MKIILLRHGESIDDILNCYGGAADYDLSEDGKKTAKEVAELLKSKQIDAIYSSPLKRAYQTAEIVNNLKQCSILIAKNLYERNSYGVMSGTNKDECKKIFGYILKNIEGKAGDYYSDSLVTGAEPLGEFDERVRNGLLEVITDAEKKGYEHIAIVTHGNVTRSIYKNALNVAGKVDLDLLAITELDYRNGVYTIESNSGITIKNA